MKRCLFALLIISCTNSNSDTPERSSDVDSANEIVAVEKVSDDSIKRAESEYNNPETVKRLSEFVTFKEDVFNNLTRIEPKSKPEFRNIEGVYCYFIKKGTTVSDFRFVIQFVSPDLFIIIRQELVIDGKSYAYSPRTVYRDNREGKFWEYSDEPVKDADVNLIAALAKATTAKIHFDGRHRSYDRAITAEELKSIRDVFGLYKAMGGRL